MKHPQSLIEIIQYCTNYSTPQNQELSQLEKLTHLHTIAPQMMAGPHLGLFLEFFTSALRPRSILEVGSFTGYATLCLARGLHAEGKLTTIDVNPEIEYLVREVIQKSAFADKIDLHIANALELIPQLDGDFELIYLDANKRDYVKYYNLLIKRLAPEGFLIIDNVLWDGKVLDPEKDFDSQEMHAFNKMVSEDDRVQQLLLPIRDGIMIIRLNQ